MKERLRAFIIRDFMSGEGVLKDDESLFEAGIIDSLGFIRLLAFAEKTFGVPIDMRDVSIEDFDTVDKIVRILEEKTDKR